MEQIFSAIPTVLKGLDQHAEIDQAVVFAAWSRCAGDLLRDRTIPVEYAGKRLIVAVADTTWKRHLEELSPTMLFKINGSVGPGVVKFIEFRVDEPRVNESRKKLETDTVNDTAEITPSLAKAAMAIADANLREQFLSTATSYLYRQKL